MQIKIIVLAVLSIVTTAAMAHQEWFSEELISPQSMSKDIIKKNNKEELLHKIKNEDLLQRHIINMPINTEISYLSC